jgi:hypothetical protein
MPSSPFPEESSQSRRRSSKNCPSCGMVSKSEIEDAFRDLKE